MHRRIPLAIFAALLAGVLAACGSSAGQPAAPAADQPAPTTIPAAPNAQPALAAPTQGSAAGGAPTAQPANSAASAPSAMRTFKIVPEQTEASYEVQEQFLNRDLPSQALGKTNTVSGELQLSLDGKPNGKVTNITVDLRTLTSNESRRDNRIRQQWLESNTYPYAVFTSTDVQGIPDSYTEGQDVTFKLTGDMTIRDVTKPITFDVTGKLLGDTITGSATGQVLMKDFGFDPPSIAGMLTVKDGVTIKINFTAKEAK
jgi:polyisoprenoid-binding protein YceI